MHAALARGDVVMQHGVNGPERAVLRDRFEETVRGNQVRLLDILKLDRREVGVEGLMSEIEQFVVGDEDVSLESLDAHALDDLPVFDGETVLAVGAVHAFLMDDLAGARVERIEEDAAVREGVSPGGEIREAVPDEDAAANRPRRFRLPVSADQPPFERNEPRRSEPTLLPPFQGDRFQWPALQGLKLGVGQGPPHPVAGFSKALRATHFSASHLLALITLPGNREQKRNNAYLSTRPSFYRS